MDKRILITGGCGFIGANLVKYLLDRGNCEIVALDNLSAGSEENLDRAIGDSAGKGTVTFLCGDIRDMDCVTEAMENCSDLIHLAAHTQVVESLKSPSINFDINTVGTFTILEAARKQGVEKFIFASSNAAVGEQEPPIHEGMVPRPISPYGAGKLNGESMCSAYYHSYGIKTVSLRFSNVYGPYSDHKTSVISKFIKRVKDGLPLEIYGDGKQTRDFIHAEDICQAIYKCLTYSGKENIYGDIFQVGTGVETSIIELAEMIRELAGKYNSQEYNIVFKDILKGEIKKNYSDISKIQKVLGFSVANNINKSLSKLF